jgi:hypothetical protein
MDVYQNMGGTPQNLGCTAYTMEAIVHNMECKNHNTVATSHDMWGTVHKKGTGYNTVATIRSTESRRLQDGGNKS